MAPKILKRPSAAAKKPAAQTGEIINWQAWKGDDEEVPLSQNLDGCSDAEDKGAGNDSEENSCGEDEPAQTRSRTKTVQPGYDSSGHEF